TTASASLGQALARNNYNTFSLRDAIPISAAGAGRAAPVRYPGIVVPLGPALPAGSGGKRYQARRHLGSYRHTTDCAAGQRSCQRSEEHTSELQSRENLVCRLLLEKKKLNG